MSSAGQPPEAPRGAQSEAQKKAADYATEQDWPGYFRAVAGKPPRDTLMRALDLFDLELLAPGAAPRFAVDLGCGEGRDTVEMLRRGWRVLAIDSHAEAFERLRARISGEDRLRLDMAQVSFSEARIPPADLMNASYALPFCLPDDFPSLWQRIRGALKPGGRFAGQFFGDRDDWARIGDRTHLTRAQVEDCLRGFDLELFNEEEKDDTMAGGGMKHWHVFHVVGRRK